MSNSDFQLHEDDMTGIRSRRVIDNTSGLTKFIMNHSAGMIQTPTQASIVMIVVSILCIWGVFAFMPGESQETQQNGIEAPQGKTIEYNSKGPAQYR